MGSLQMENQTAVPGDIGRSSTRNDTTMWIKFSTDYVAGIVVGAGFLLLLLSLSADSGMISADGLKGAGTKFVSLAMIFAGGGMKWRAQSRLKQ